MQRTYRPGLRWDDGGMKRTITGLATNRRMTLGDLRHFLASVENVPDEAILKGRVGFGRGLKSVTIEEDDIGFDEYVRAVASEEEERAPARSSP
jgi:hypothetical protein